MKTQVHQKSRTISSRAMATMRRAVQSSCRAYFERKARLAGPLVPTTACLSWAFWFYRHVLGQPVEYVGAVPADGLATVSAPLGKLPEGRQTQQ
jgi:hypothetical protein